MLISTRGRYALRVMIELAGRESGEYIPLKSISENQQISLKYLEIIVALLNKDHLLESHRGKNGGYRLNRDINMYSVGEILRATEEGLVPVDCSCLKDTEELCDRAETCLTQPLWKGLDKALNTYLNKISLEDLKEGNIEVYK